MSGQFVAAGLSEVTAMANFRQSEMVLTDATMVTDSPGRSQAITKTDLAVHFARFSEYFYRQPSSDDSETQYSLSAKQHGRTADAPSSAHSEYSTQNRIDGTSHAAFCCVSGGRFRDC